MRVVFLVPGKTNDASMSRLIADYVARIGHYVPFQIQVLPELRNVASLSQNEIKQRQGELMLKALQATDRLVLLDEHGSELRSVEFAKFVQKQMSASPKRLVFLAGGAYGFADSVCQRANYKLSLSRMTFSHQMVRLVFVEQLYRAFTIINGEPYHHE